MVGVPAEGEPTVRALERGLAVLRALGPRPLTLAEVARAAELDRAAARRFLLTLQAQGYAATDGRTWALRPRVLELGHAYLRGLGLPEVARPHLEALSAEVHESCSVAVLDGEEVVYVARVQAERIMRVDIAVGTRFAAARTSMGRVLLAAAGDPAWAEVARAGHAIADGQLEEGLRSVAVPLHDVAGRVVAALNVSTQAARVPLDDLRGRVLPALRRTAAAIEDDLRHVAG